MPLYEYECRKCGENLEVIQKFSDPELTECPSCGGRLDKLLSAPAIQFKGSGWYITDYSKKGAAGSESAGSGGTESGGSKDSKKSESESKPKSKVASAEE